MWRFWYGARSCPTSVTAASKPFVESPNPNWDQIAQIEKEPLAIVFACEKFDKYIFGRDVIHVETDHKAHKLQDCILNTAYVHVHLRK